MRVKLATVDDDERLRKNLKEDLNEFNEIKSVITCTNSLKFVPDLKSIPVLCKESD